MRGVLNVRSLIALALLPEENEELRSEVVLYFLYTLQPDY